MQSINYDSQIIRLIKKMRTSQVNQAEQQLLLLVNNSQFMQIIFGIIKNPQLQGWVKTIASSFLNRVITQRLQELGYKTMFSAISNIMSSLQIQPSDKRCFQRSLVTLIQYIKQPQQIQEWESFINKYISTRQLFDTGLLLISCTAISQIPTDYLCRIVENTYEQTLKKFSINIQNSYMINQLIKNWIVVFDKLKTFEQDQYVHNIMTNMCKSQNLAQLLLQIYRMQTPSQVWLCVKPQLFELNMLKYQAAQLNGKIINHAIKIQLNKQECPSLKFICQSFNIIKNTVAIIGTNLQILQNYQCQDFITSLFTLLIGSIKTTIQPKKQQMQVLIHIACYPFLKTRDQQIYIFQQSPIQFNTLMQDLCDKQQFGILKTEAGRLLEAIGDICPEALQSSVIFSVQCIKMKMGFVPIIENTEMRLLDVQVAFSVLSIHSFSLERFPTLLQSLKIILLDKRMMQLVPLQISKIFLFLAYNYSQVFNNPLDGNIWIQFALNYYKHPTARYMALDFLSNISDQYFTEAFLNQFILLINKCEQKQIGQIWAIIGKIFDHHKLKINQNLCINLVNAIFSKIQSQVLKLNNRQKQSTLDIINGLHILRKIIQDFQYVSTKLNLMKIIFNITMIYNQAIQLNIQDQIIKILTQYIKIFKQKIPQQVYTLLPQILQQFKKTQYHQKSYLILFNQIIIKGQYKQIIPIIKALISGLMFHLFDMSSKAQKLKQKVVIANILTLLQNFIPIHGFQMSNSQQNGFCQIQSMCMRLFPSQKDQKIFSKKLLAKALNLMFLCHLYNRSQNTVQYLFLYSKQNIFHNYDAYVLVKLLSKALFSQSNIQIVIEYLNLMIDITIQQQNHDKKNNKNTKNAKGKMRIKRQQQLDKILYKITTPFIDFQLAKKQKYPIKLQIQQCISKMKSQNIQTYKIIIIKMSEEKKAKLTTLLNQVTQIQGKKRVIRKVIGIKDKKQEKQQENNNSDIQEDQIEANNFKRNRVQLKKIKQKKNKNNNENIYLE